MELRGNNHRSLTLTLTINDNGNPEALDFFPALKD